MDTILLFTASNLFVACLIACLASAVGRSGRHATIAHWLWLAVFLKLITPPILFTAITVPHAWTAPLESVYRTFVPFSVTATDYPTDQLASALPGAGDVDSQGLPATPLEGSSVSGGPRLGDPTGPLYFSWDYRAWGMLIWGCGACFIIGRGGLRYARFSKLLHAESVIDENATSIAKRLLGNAMFVPPVRLISARVSPMLFGIGRQTCIVCPDRLWNSLSNVDREAFLAHELAHFRRRDHWIRWLEWIVTAVYWWFPLVYMARKQLERHEEAACDAYAIASLQTSPRTYAEALLNVVDFLSETKIGIPRLASRMQPTDTLEDRLRLIMATEQRSLPRSLRLALFALSLMLILTHPRLSIDGNVALPATPELATRSSPNSDDQLQPSLNHDTPQKDSWPQMPLPAVPDGWWNERPQSLFADVQFGERALKIWAEAGVGVSVQRGDGTTHMFDSGSICALAYVPNSGRLVLGNKAGELHLWDATVSQSASLIGRHQGAISSIAFHPIAGLVSGGADGMVARWDLQSGELLKSIALTHRISSVRWSQHGEQLAILSGNWTEVDQVCELHLIHGRTFERLDAFALSPTTAVVQYHEQQGWLAVDWSGDVSSLATREIVFVVPKSDVTGLVLCQESFDAILPAEASEWRPSASRRGEAIPQRSMGPLQ